MPFRHAAVAVLALLAWSEDVRAQDRRLFEVGGFLQWTAFDNSLRIDDFFTPGGFIGVALKGPFALEADVARSSTNGPPTVEVTYLPIHARLTYAMPVRGRMTALVGAGYVHNSYGASRDGSDNGVTGLAGIRFGLRHNLSVRIDMLADYMPNPANGGGTVNDNWNLGFRQGLSIGFGPERGAALAPSPEPRVQEVIVLTPPTPATIPNSAPDSDRDGVSDATDRCPETPAGMAVDSYGCPLDSDADGVPDRLDRCPSTPAGTSVDAAGCPLDSDRDGVPDLRDRCPDTPSGTTVDANGCSLDSDHDGIPDAIDRCPGTPPGTRVDATGCLLLFEENKKSLVLEGVNFANGKAELTEESKAILNNVATSLVANSAVRVRVEGHTSSTGNRNFNTRLSQARAESVKAYLVSRGVAADRLVARGFGPDSPIASNATDEGQAKNRRVELSKLD